MTIKERLKTAATSDRVVNTVHAVLIEMIITGVVE